MRRWYQARLSFVAKFLLCLFGIPASVIAISFIGFYLYNLVRPFPAEVIQISPGLLSKPNTSLALQKSASANFDTKQLIPTTINGYSFVLPWNEVLSSTVHEMPKNATDDQFYGITVHNKNNEYLFTKNDLLLESDWPSLLGDNQKSKVFTASQTQSKIAVLSAILNTVPQDASIRNGLHARQRAVSLLAYKTMYVFDVTHIDAIQLGEMRGFEFSGGSIPNHYKLILIDKADHAIELDYEALNKDDPTLTQAKINAIVQSMHPVTRTAK